MVAELAVALALTSAGDVDYPGCNTRLCVARVQTRAHHRTLRRWRRRARPYQPWLAQVRECESRGHYGTATGNGFWGAYQFTLSSWHVVGGRGYPHRAAPAEQDYRAVRLLKLQGPGAWPVCGR